MYVINEEQHLASKVDRCT